MEVLSSLTSRTLVAAAIAVGLSVAAHAERRIALVMGNSAYASISPLANPARDAELMAKTLEASGFEVTRVIDADQRRMKQAMLDFGRKLREGTEASLFFYAGHGVQANGANYLIPIDAAIRDESELDLQAIDVNAFLRVMENSASKVNIVVLDACRNNPFASAFRSGSRGLAMVDAPRGSYIAYSTSPGEVAEDGGVGNSPYTVALTTAMTRPGVNLEATFKEARRLVLAATSDRQVPWETSSVTGDFYFRPGASSVQEDAPLCALAGDHWAIIKDKADTRLLEEHINTYGVCPTAPLARARLAGLQPKQEQATPAPYTDANSNCVKIGSSTFCK